MLLLARGRFGLLTCPQCNASEKTYYFDRCHLEDSMLTHFPFFLLPRELRDEIYYFTLLSINPVPLKPILLDNTIHIQKKVSCEPTERKFISAGTEASTRLFRVCRQISDEALQVFYSAFNFQICDCTTNEVLTRMLRDTLTPIARSRIRYVTFYVDNPLPPGFPSVTQMLWEYWARNIETMLQLLPQLRSPHCRQVKVIFGFGGTGMAENLEPLIVEFALRVLGCLDRVEKLTVEASIVDNENGEQMKKVYQQIEKTWGHFDNQLALRKDNNHDVNCP